MYPSCTCCHLSIIRRFFISCTSSLSLHVLPLSCVKENHRVLRLWSPLLRQPGHRASLSSPCLPGDFMSLYMFSSAHTAELLSGRLSASAVVYCAVICTLRALIHIQPSTSDSNDQAFGWQLVFVLNKGLDCMACLPLKISFVLYFVEWWKDWLVVMSL